MIDDSFACANCGQKLFKLHMIDIHLKGVCHGCHEPVLQTDSNYPHFIEYIDPDVDAELATEKQISYIKYLLRDNGWKLSRVLAGDIIKRLIEDVEV